MNIPFKNKNITASAPFIILNNHFVSGTMVLPDEGMRLLKRDTSSVINIETYDFKLETTYEELGGYFSSIGITDFRIVKENLGIKTTIMEDMSAMKYEFMIRRAFDCVRFKKGADADIFRRLQELEHFANEGSQDSKALRQY